MSLCRYTWMILLALTCASALGEEVTTRDCDWEFAAIYRDRAVGNGPTCVDTEVGSRVCYRRADNSSRIQYFTSTDVYLGWRTFKTYCHACHAEHHGDDSSRRAEAETPPGEATAPEAADMTAEDTIADLIERRRQFGHSPDLQALFTTQVMHGLKPADSKLAMPPWRSHPLVARRIDDVYAYLLARADCALPHVEHGRIKRCRSKTDCPPPAAASVPATDSGH